MVGRLIMSVLFTLSLLPSTTIEGGRLLLMVTHDDNPSSSLPRMTKEEKVMMLRGPEIGSRPPRCKGRCKSCGHCEAVQVPTTISISVSNIEYKPITWKCKCGTFLFNP